MKDRGPFPWHGFCSLGFGHISTEPTRMSEGEFSMPKTRTVAMSALSSSRTGKSGSILMGGVASAFIFSAGAAMAQQAPAPMPPALGPSISGPLSYNPAPITLNLGPYAAKVYVTGADTGLGFWESNATTYRSDRSSRVDISNGQLLVPQVDW